ncbi:MAG TPA: tetratricopeptide repeat protein [Actinomycetota bacterium]|nr:tetratricopeptide repeat protein [Actinomycetota bacterium]
MRTRIIAVGGLALLMFVGGAVLMWSGGSALSDYKRRPVPSFGATESAAVADIDATIAAVQERVRSGAAGSSDLASLGSAYLQKARATAEPEYYRLAREALRKALRLQPENLPALLGMGELSLGRHDFAAARRWARRALAVDAHNATAYGILGDAAGELGRYDDAFVSFQRMMDLRPNLSSYARASYARELTGDVSGAIAAMERAVAAGATAADEAWARTQLGDLYFNSGRLGAAAREYRWALFLAPDFVPPDAGLGRVDAARGSIKRAIRRYESIVERYPLPQYVATLGDLYEVSGRTTESLRQYDLVAAQEKLFVAAGVIPDVEVTLFLADQGNDPRSAVRLVRAQYAQRPSIRVADALAWSLYKSGRYAEARKFSREALRLGTRDASYHYHAGMIAKKLGEHGAARSHLSRALAINPNFSILYATHAERVLGGLR